MTTAAPRVFDTRTASADVTDVPELRTPSGRDPIEPCGIDVEYSIATGRPGAISVRGYRPGALAAMRRSIRDVHSAPAWVRKFVADNTPLILSAALTVEREWRTGDGVDIRTEADNRLWTALDELGHAVTHDTATRSTP